MKLSVEEIKDLFDIWLRYEEGKVYWIKTSSSKAIKHQEAGWFDKDGYLVVTIKGHKLRMARLIWMIHNGEIPKGYHVDHIDGDKLNNKIENLRLATPSENSCNRGKQNNNTTGAKGVVFTKGKYQVIVWKSNKHHYVGTFDTKDDAVKAYNKISKLLHKEFHRASR